jgi:hypothetical protein
MAKRIFFGSSALAIKSKYVSGFGSDGTETTTDGQWVVPRGIQSVGFSTSVAFEPMFQLGQTEVYGRMESQSPQVECTISKAIDGSQMLYTTLNGGHAAANNKAPAELASNEVQIALGVYAESVPYASGNTQAAVHCSGMYVSNLQIQLPLDGVATEELTLVGDTRRWLDSTNPIAAQIGNDATERGVIGSGSAPSAYQRWTLDTAGSTLPLGVKDYPLQSVNVTMSIGREVIQELGTRGKYCRYATFPFEVTSEFEVIAGRHRSGADGVSGNDQAIVVSGYDFRNFAGYACASADVYSTTSDGTPDPLGAAGVDGGQIDGGFRDQQIKVKLCGATSSDYLIIDLGTKNRVTSVNYAGGDTGGGNVTLTYSFQNYNYLQLDGAGSYAANPTITWA